jgi:hypothetical protein
MKIDHACELHLVGWLVSRRTVATALRKKTVVAPDIPEHRLQQELARPQPDGVLERTSAVGSCKNSFGAIPQRGQRRINASHWYRPLTDVPWNTKHLFRLFYPLEVAWRHAATGRLARHLGSDKMDPRKRLERQFCLLDRWASRGLSRHELK